MQIIVLKTSGCSQLHSSIISQSSDDPVTIDNKEIYNSENSTVSSAPQMNPNTAYSINTSSYGYTSSLAKSDTGNQLYNNSMKLY